jgi:hypothetical protein
MENGARLAPGTQSCAETLNSNLKTRQKKGHTDLELVFQTVGTVA